MRKAYNPVQGEVSKGPLTARATRVIPALVKWRVRLLSSSNRSSHRSICNIEKRISLKLSVLDPASLIASKRIGNHEPLSKHRSQIGSQKLSYDRVGLSVISLTRTHFRSLLHKATNCAKVGSWRPALVHAEQVVALSARTRQMDKRDYDRHRPPL
jgi:hypothetical protein